MPKNSHKHATCSICSVRKESLMGLMYCDELDHVQAHKVSRNFKKNQSLFLEGASPRGVYCINEGMVKLFQRGDEGKEQIIRIAKAGEIVGFKSLFNEIPYQVTAETLEESNICFIGKEDFLDMMDANPILRKAVIKELSHELSDREDFITNMSQKSVRERLAFTFIILQKIYVKEPINLSREDLANFVGTATETLIRLLKDFKEEGIIEVHTRKISILNNEKLLFIAGK